MLCNIFEIYLKYKYNYLIKLNYYKIIIKTIFDVYLLFNKTIIIVYMLLYGLSYSDCQIWRFFILVYIYIFFSFTVWMYTQVNIIVNFYIINKITKL